MVDIEDSEHRATIMQELANTLEFLRSHEDFGPGLLHKINDAVLDIRIRCRKQGIDFPPMAAVILPSLKAFEIYRADLDRAAIERTVVALYRQYAPQGLDMIELAEAIKAAYPDFKPRLAH